MREAPPAPPRRPLPPSLARPAAPASAQFIPYYGKNKVKYDNFAWRVYKSPHFEVFYYPEFEQHLARLTSYLESGYLKISTGLKHEMPKPIPVIFYKTHSEFEQTNLFPAFVPEGVAAFTEPLLNRMVIPIDEPPDRLQGLITHEMTHAFAFDLIPRGIGFGISQRAIPLWVDEGLADYFRGIWEPLDLMMIRDAALTDKVPKLSRVGVRGASPAASSTTWATPASSSSRRATARRASASSSTRCARASWAAGTEELFKQAFRTTPEEFDAAFDKWLKERFKPFRDKQRPDDFGRDLSPNPEKTSFTQAFALRARAPRARSPRSSPRTAPRARPTSCCVSTQGRHGDPEPHRAASTRDVGELRHQQRVRGRPLARLRPERRQRRLLRPHRQGPQPLPGLARSTARCKKKVHDRRSTRSQAPCLLADGQHACSSPRSRRASPTSGRSTSRRARSRTSPRTSTPTTTRRSRPDGKLVVYERRISGNAKIYAFPLADPARKTQLTFGPFDDDGAVSSRPTATKLYYSSDEDDDIPNLRSLDLQTGAIAAVHRRLRRHDGAGAAQDAARRPPRLHHLLQGRVQAAHARTPRSR